MEKRTNHWHRAAVGCEDVTRGPTIRFSKGEAEREAIRLAERLVAADGGAGWTCLGASPNVSARGYKKRKNVIKWSGAFDRSSGGVIVDGPVIVHVDLETGAANYF